VSTQSATTAIRCALALLACILTLDTGAQTLRRDLATLRDSFAAGAFSEAAACHDALIADYGEEPELQAEPLARTIRTLGGIAHFLSGDPSGAATLLQPLENEPTAAVAHFFLAQAYMQSGSAEAGVGTHMHHAADPVLPQTFRLLHLVAAGLAADTAALEPATTTALRHALRAQLDQDEAATPSEWSADLDLAALALLRLSVATGEPDAILDCHPQLIGWAQQSRYSMTHANLLLRAAAILAGRDESIALLRAVSPLLDPLRIAESAPAVSTYHGIAALCTHYIGFRARALEDAAAATVNQARDGWIAYWIFNYARALRRGGFGLEAAVVLEATERLALEGNAIRPLIAEERILAETEAGEPLRALALCRAAIAGAYADATWTRRMHIHLARALAAAGELDAAIAEVTSVLDTTNDGAERMRWLFERGKLHLQAENPPAARADLSVVAGVAGPLGESARLMHALTHMSERAWDSALEELSAFAFTLDAGHPAHPLIAFHCAHARVQLDQPEEAVAIIAKLIRDGHDPELIAPTLLLGSAARVQTGDLRGALDWLDLVESDSARLMSEVSLRRARILLALERHTAAREIAEAWLYADPKQVADPAMLPAMISCGTDTFRDDPDGRRAWIERAFARFGSMEGASGMVELARQMSDLGTPAPVEPTGEASLIELRRAAGHAQHLRAAGRPDIADALLYSIYEYAAPEDLDADIAVDVAALLVDMEYPTAREYLDAALGNAQPDWSGAGRARLLAARHAINRRDHTDALAQADAALRLALDPALGAEARMIRAEARLATDDTEGAIADLEKVVSDRSLPPSLVARALLRMAEALQGLDAVADAEACLHRIISVYRGERATRAEALVRYASIVSARGEREAAITALRDVIDDPSPLDLEVRRRATDALAQLRAEPDPTNP